MFEKSKDHNENYLASVIEIKNLRKHVNADRLQVTTVFGNNVITSLDCQLGQKYIYFPLECAIAPEFLSFTNSFDDPVLNADKNAKGMFKKQGRVKAIRLRQENSDGFIMPIKALQDFVYAKFGKNISDDQFVDGTDFDLINGFLLLWKYIPRTTKQGAQRTAKVNPEKRKKYVSKLVENQFRLHQNTYHLGRNMHLIKPDSFVSITKKYHGTSFVVSNVRVKKQLSVYQKVLKFVGADIADTEYGMLYSSREVIKNRNFVTNQSQGYYGEDIWKIVADKVFPFLKEGISVYGEIVGHMPSGKQIQKGFDYGCLPGAHEIYIYRVTYTSYTGETFEFSHRQVQAWCDYAKINMVKTYYYGQAKHLYPYMSPNADGWSDQVLAQLIADYLEKDCDQCTVPNTPDEGVVVRVDEPNVYSALKLKSFRFKERESKENETGEIDVETQQSLGEEAEELVTNESV